MGGRRHSERDMSPDVVSSGRRRKEASPSPPPRGGGGRSRSRSRTYSSGSPPPARNGRGGSYERDRRRHDDRDRRRSPGRSYGGGGRDYGYGGGSGSSRRYYDGRDNPPPSPVLGVFGMSLHTTERDLKHLFGKYGDVESVQIVYDRFSGRSRGFGFAKERMQDAVIDGMHVRVDYSVTRTGGPYRHVPDRSRSRSRSPRGGGGKRPSRSVSRSRSPSR